MNILEELGNLSSSAVRNLAQNLFSGFYDRGISANKALQELKDLGLGYRRTDFLADYAQGKGTFELKTRVRFTGLDNVPSEKILSPKYFGTPDKYSFVFKYSGQDTTTGEDTSGYFFYHRNSLDTRSNMEDDAMDWLSNQSENYGVDVSSVRIVEGYINPLWQ